MEKEVDERYGRFKGLPWFELAKFTEILLLGSGGTGSWIALLLARAGFKLTIIDFDTVEVHNLGGQIFRNDSIGKLKINAIKDVIKDFSILDNINILNQKISEEFNPTNSIVITAFDNIESRKLVFDRWKEEYKDNPHAIFIDPRLEAEQMFIYSIRGNDLGSIKDYEENRLKVDIVSDEVDCTRKQTSHMAAMIASNVVSIITNHLTNISEGEAGGRIIPYRIEQFVPLMIYNQILFM